MRYNINIYKTAFHIVDFIGWISTSCVIFWMTENLTWLPGPNIPSDFLKFSKIFLLVNTCLYNFNIVLIILALFLLNLGIDEDPKSKIAFWRINTK